MRGGKKHKLLPICFTGPKMSSGGRTGLGIYLESAVRTCPSGKDNHCDRTLAPNKINQEMGNWDAFNGHFSEIDFQYTEH